jgi:hypothetical protein
MNNEMREPLTQLLSEFSPEAVNELRAKSAHLSAAERQRLISVAHHHCPNLWIRDEWSEFDALPPELKAEVEAGISLTVLETIDDINYFLGMCKRGD